MHVGTLEHKCMIIGVSATKLWKKMQKATVTVNARPLFCEVLLKSGTVVFLNINKWLIKMVIKINKPFPCLHHPLFVQQLYHQFLRKTF